MNQGFILLHRKIRNNVLWPKSKPFTKIEAWLDLLMMARFDKEPIEILLGNEIVMCGRGQIVRSINTYQNRWNWGAQRVKSFFEILLKLKQIEKKTTTKTTIITICNYDSYQSEQQTDNKRIINGKQTENKRITTKKQRAIKLNNENNVNNNIPAYSDFKLFAFSKKENIDNEVLKLKYDAWVENGWKDGYNKPIKNWKSKLLNTIPHLKESVNGKFKKPDFEKIKEYGRKLNKP